MKNKFDISQFIDTITEQSVTEGIVVRFVKRRKELKISQKELAIRSGVSYASIRRFEKSGDVSLCSLIKLAHAIDCLVDFEELFKNQKIASLKDL